MTRAGMITHNTNHLSVNEFHDALGTAFAGDTIVYATGDLGMSRYLAGPKSELHVMAEIAYAAQQAGRVCLTQKRIGGRFEYRATKRDLIKLRTLA